MTPEAAAGKPQVVVYTDGACAGNPGPGGWGVILISGDHRKELSGGEPATTNNRMELMAAISALEALTKPARVDIHTDSEYVQKGISAWISSWKRNAWRTSARPPAQHAPPPHPLAPPHPPHHPPPHSPRAPARPPPTPP